MRYGDLTRNEYIDYLITLRNSIYKILPLYEEENEFLVDYIMDVIDEVEYLKMIIEELPRASWYVKTRTNLYSILFEVYENNHSLVRKKVLNTTNLIKREIINVEGG